MEYKGKYNIFDSSLLKTYPLKDRKSRVQLNDILDTDVLSEITFDLPDTTIDIINFIAEKIILTRKERKPVIFFTGAHLIKNGLGMLLAGLVNKNIVTLVGGNGATSIHDFELALIGKTSEDALNALKEARFGMTVEFSYINEAIFLGNRLKVGFGESLGRFICDSSFRDKISSRLKTKIEFLYPEKSILATCYKQNTPFTVHVGIGTDVIDQHRNFDGEAKGGCSARDFYIFASEISKCKEGGMFLNVGSAVTGPEVFLKAVAICSNTGNPPRGIITADFDIREEASHKMTDESSCQYYYRDQKSVVTRIPQAFDGRGFYIKGDQKQTIPVLYNKIMEKLKKERF